MRWRGIMLAAVGGIASSCAMQPTASVGESAGRGAAQATAAVEPFWQEIPSAAFRFEMVPIPGDAAQRIEPFWMSRCEITWEPFDVFVYNLDEQAVPPGVDAVTRPSKPYLPPDRGFGHEGYPAISMSFHNAQEFCRWLSVRSGRTYRLPTVEEWRHAAAAGAGARDEAPPDDIAWYAANAGNTTHPVGTKAPNAWGLHDMLGNVQEWCVGEGGSAVTMGGSYRDDASKIEWETPTPQDRAWNASDPQIPKSKWWLADGPFVGFRVVCEQP